MLHRDLHVNTICALFNADVLAHGSWFFSLGSWPFGYTCIHPSIYPLMKVSLIRCICALYSIILYCIVLYCAVYYCIMHCTLVYIVWVFLHVFIVTRWSSVRCLFAIFILHLNRIHINRFIEGTVNTNKHVHILNRQNIESERFYNSNGFLSLFIPHHTMRISVSLNTPYTKRSILLSLA